MAILLFRQADGAETKGFGLGVIFGQPSGILAATAPREQMLIDFGATWSWNDWWLILADCKFKDYLTPSSLDLAGYYGLGAYGGSSDSDEGAFGLRIPLGIIYHVPYTRLEVFCEAVPCLEMFPKTQARLQAGIGALLWLSHRR
jgi:hypothetical protein